MRKNNINKCMKEKNNMKFTKNYKECCPTKTYGSELPKGPSPQSVREVSYYFRVRLLFKNR